MSGEAKQTTGRDVAVEALIDMHEYGAFYRARKLMVSDPMMNRQRSNGFELLSIFAVEWSGVEYLIDTHLVITIFGFASLFN